MQALKKQTRQNPAKLLVFPTRMGTPPQNPDTNGRRGHDPQRHGNFAQIGTGIVAILAFLIGCATLFMTIYFHHSDAVAKTTDEHINGLIDSKLTPAKTEINAKIDTKADELGKKIDALSNKISYVDGKLGIQISELKTKTEQQASLARLQDPNRTLTLVRAEIESAEKNGRQLPESTLVDYRNAVRELPVSANEYWTTLALIINYQSKLNQMSGEAPDPAKVSKPCMGLTNQGNIHSFGNLYSNETFSNCIVDLDNETFRQVTFMNSVIRYSGGNATLAGVRFVNCRFILKLAANTKPAGSPLLMALLEAGDQTTIKITLPATHN
jgi:hypothetical protein